MYGILFLIAIGAIATTLLAGDFSGRWSGTIETRGRRVPIYITLNQHAQGVSGIVATGDGAKRVPMEKPRIDSDELTFEVHDNASRIVTFRLSLNTVISGEATLGNEVSKVFLSRLTMSGVARGGGAGSRLAFGSGAGPGSTSGSSVFRVGGGVSAPVLIHKVEPEYTEEAHAAKYQGTVQLYTEVAPNGTATNITVQRSLGLGLDEKAIEAVKQWKFKPGEKDGKPVTVAATIEVNFRL